MKRLEALRALLFNAPANGVSEKSGFAVGIGGRVVSEKRFWAEKRYGVLFVIFQKYRGFARNPGCRSADESVWIVFLGERFWGNFF